MSSLNSAHNTIQYVQFCWKCIKHNIICHILLYCYIFCTLSLLLISQSLRSGRRYGPTFLHHHLLFAHAPVKKTELQILSILFKACDWRKCFFNFPVYSCQPACSHFDIPLFFTSLY